MKMINKNLYVLRNSLAVVIFIITTFAFMCCFPGIDKVLYLQLGPQIVKTLKNFSLYSAIIILFFFLLTFLFGRFYCSIICPFGLIQDFIGFILKKKTGKASNFYIIRYLIFSIVFGLLIGGSILGLKILDPYTNFGLILSSFSNFSSLPLLIYTILGFLIITFLVFLKNRIFCTTICPIGTILGICAKNGLFKLHISSECIKCGMCENECPTGCISSNKIDNELCIRCMKCVSKCPKQAIKFEKGKKQEPELDKGRRKFIFKAVCFSVAIASIKTGFLLAKESLKTIKKRLIYPPGAGSYEKFSSKCISCNLCVVNCKGKVLKSTDLEHNAIHLDFSSGKCEYDCNLCGQICPTNAIKKISLEEKQQCQIGIAKLDYSKCILCGACIAECPRRAIERGDAHINILSSSCIGCGACENICPMKAITVETLIEQKIIDM